MLTAIDLLAWAGGSTEECLTYGSLFSGIGGLDLGLERAGMRCAWQVEVDPFCRAVLQKHWPEARQYADITEVDATKLGAVDLVAGGFPCQPHSQAGKRLASKDDRNLWPEFARVVGAVRPRWVLVENVPGLLSSEGGAFFAGVLGDLARMGYRCEWGRVGAAHVGAQHLRLRVFLVAYADDQRREGGHCEGCVPPGGTHPHPHSHGEYGGRGAEPHGEALQGQTGVRRHPGGLRDALPHTGAGRGLSPDAPPILALIKAALYGGGQGEQAESGVGGGLDGLPTWLDGVNGRRMGAGGPRETPSPRVFTEGPKDSGRWGEDWEDGIPRTVEGRQPQRTPRLRALGNAVVPQVAEYVGRLIVAAVGGGA